MIEIINKYATLKNAINLHDGSSGVQYSVICHRLVCLNGMVRYLGGAKDQLRISIQHSKSAVDRIKKAQESAVDRIKKAQEIIAKRQQDIEMIKREAELFIGTKMTKDEFVKEVLPVVLKKMNLFEKDKDRQRGHERIEREEAFCMVNKLSNLGLLFMTNEDHTDLYRYLDYMRKDFEDATKKSLKSRKEIFELFNEELKMKTTITKETDHISDKISDINKLTALYLLFIADEKESVKLYNEL